MPEFQSELKQAIMMTEYILILLVVYIDYLYRLKCTECKKNENKPVLLLMQNDARATRKITVAAKALGSITKVCS